MVERLLQGINIAVSPGTKLTVWRGDIVRMHISFNYRGSAITPTLRCSIGQRVLGVFDEIAYNHGAIPLGQSFDFVPYTAYIDIDTSAISPGANYDIEAKIEEYPETLVGIDNVIDVIGDPEFANFDITSYEIAPS